MHSKLTLEFIFMVSLEKRSISDRSRTSFGPPKNSKAKKLKPAPRFLIFETGPVAFVSVVQGAR
jgi:hypothetical protein